MHLEIREARASDADAIGYVHYHGWMETYSGLVSDALLQGRSLEKSRSIFQNLGCRDMFVAFVDEDIAGFCGYGKVRGGDVPSTWGEIQGIYVLKKYQRMSIGKQLLEKSLCMLSHQGYEAALLWVLKNNSKAISFYEKNRFHFDGTERTEILGTPVVEKRYVRIL